MNRLILSLVSLAAAYSVTVFYYQAVWSTAACINLGYYLLLLFNTYFSLSFTERAFHIRNGPDAALNLLLTMIYLVLPWFIADTFRFHLFMAAFFVIAVAKYASWLTVSATLFFLRRKIPANAGGALLSVLTVGLLQALGDRYSAQMATVAVTVFGLANIWVLLIDPLYRAE